MSVMWNALMNFDNPGEKFSNAFLGGIKQNRADAADAEDRQFKRDQLSAQTQRQGREDASRQLEQFQGTIDQAAEMITNIKTLNPQMPDEQVYATVRQHLIQTRAPGAEQSPEPSDPSFPQYYQGLLARAKPKDASRPQLVPYTQGGGVAAYNPQTGQLQTLVMPNPGDQPTGAPVSTPRPLTDEQIRAMEGGQAAPPPATFR